MPKRAPARCILLGCFGVFLSVCAVSTASDQESEESFSLDVAVLVNCVEISESLIESLIGRELRKLGDVQRVTKEPNYIITVKCLPIKYANAEPSGISYSYLFLSQPNGSHYADALEKENELLATGLRLLLNRSTHIHYFGNGVTGSDNLEEAVAKEVVASFDNVILVEERQGWREWQDFWGEPEDSQ